MAGLGLAMWMLPRLLKTTLQGGRFALLGAVLWNAGLIAGVGSIAVGLTTGLEWLEMPWQIALLGQHAVGARLALPGAPRHRRAEADSLPETLLPPGRTVNHR
jgi:cytochrome c oxidase cbb3-type subunit I